MIRLLLLAAAVSLACKLLTGGWPWDYLRPKRTRREAVEKARELLAVRAGASRGEILEAHRRLIATVHPDRGGSGEQVHKVNAARDLLLADLSDGN